MKSLVPSHLSPCPSVSLPEGNHCDGACQTNSFLSEFGGWVVNTHCPRTSGCGDSSAGYGSRAMLGAPLPQQGDKHHYQWCSSLYHCFECKGQFLVCSLLPPRLSQLILQRGWVHSGPSSPFPFVLNTGRNEFTVRKCLVCHQYLGSSLQVHSSSFARKVRW